MTEPLLLASSIEFTQDVIDVPFGGDAVQHKARLPEASIVLRMLMPDGTVRVYDLTQVAGRLPCLARITATPPTPADLRLAEALLDVRIRDLEVDVEGVPVA